MRRFQLAMLIAASLTSSLPIVAADGSFAITVTFTEAQIGDPCGLAANAYQPHLSAAIIESPDFGPPRSA